MSDPLVSIVVPCYNAMPHLEVLVNSVREQTYPNWELILVNDGSPDKTAEYLDSLATDERIIVHHQTNRGASAARNKAFEFVRGEYIVLADADDYLPPLSLACRAQYLEDNPDVGLVDGILSERDATLTTELSRTIPYHRGPMLPKLLKFDDRVWYSNCYMFRRAALGSNRFNEEMSYSEDFLFLIHLSLSNRLVVGYVLEETYWYRRWPGQLTSKLEGFQRGFEELARELGKIKAISWRDKLYLRYKTSRCMTLDWLVRGKPGKAISGFFRIWFAELFS